MILCSFILLHHNCQAGSWSRDLALTAHEWTEKLGVVVIVIIKEI
jgi:hypothetical protein